MSLVFFSSPASRRAARGCDGVSGRLDLQDARRHAGPRGDRARGPDRSRITFPSSTARFVRLSRLYVSWRRSSIAEVGVSIDHVAWSPSPSRASATCKPGGERLTFCTLHQRGREREQQARDDAGTQVPEGAQTRAKTHLADQRHAAPRDLRASCPAPDGVHLAPWTTAPDLSIVIVTFNGRDKALDTLRSAHDRLGAISAEWLVVDNGSSDGTADAIESAFPDVRVFRERNRGFAAGNNVALPHATGRYVLLMNPDVEIADGTLADLVSALDERPRVGVASVRQRASDGTLLASIRRFPTPARGFGEALGTGGVAWLARFQELDTDFARYDEERSADWLVGAFLIARREAIAQVGPLDERFFLYAEETDWCRRFRSQGWDVRHLPHVTITHHEGDNKRPEMVAQLGHSRRRYAYKHFVWPRAVALHASLALGHLLRVVVFAPLAALRPRHRRRAARRGVRARGGLRRAAAVRRGRSPRRRPLTSRPMEIEGATVSGFGKVLVTGGGGAIGSNVVDELVLAGADEIIVLDNFVRGRRENLDWARANGAVELVEGDIRDRALVRELMEGVDVLFHHAAIRITQCAEEPRLALEVLVDGTYNVFEAAVEAEVRKLVASSSASVYGLAEEFPTAREPPPVRQRHALWRREGLQRGAAAQLPRDVRARLRRAALLQRLRPADGRPRPLHRGARPLDGADLGGQAAADLRRRPADDGLHLHGRHRAGEHARRRSRAAPTWSTTSPAASRPACSGWPRCCSR